MKIANDDISKGKGIMFFHIPMPEHINLYNYFPYYGHKYSNVNCWSVNTGLFSVLLEVQTLNWVSVGHNHGNDFYGEYFGGITLGYGRKSGFGGSSAP